MNSPATKCSIALSTLAFLLLFQMLNYGIASYLHAKLIAITWRVIWHLEKVNRINYHRDMALYVLICKLERQRDSSYTLLKFSISFCYLWKYDHPNENSMVSNTVFVVFNMLCSIELVSNGMQTFQFSGLPIFSYNVFKNSCRFKC